MQRRVRNDNTFSGVRDEDQIPTQEFIRRVLQNGDQQDDDFTNNPWLSALEFVREQGVTLLLILGFEIVNLKITDLFIFF